jgi:hypothetical protein
MVRALVDTASIDEARKQRRHRPQEPAMKTVRPFESTLLIAAAALLCAGVQIASIESLAAPRGTATPITVVQLPTVQVSAQREAASVAVQQLPQVVVVARRDGTAGTMTAQARAPRRAI